MRTVPFTGVISTYGYPGDTCTKEEVAQMAENAYGLIIDSTIWRGWPHGWCVVSVEIEERDEGKGVVIASCWPPLYVTIYGPIERKYW